MKPLFWSAPAEADIAAIDDYWWQRDPDVADMLIARIRKAAERLSGLPEGGEIIDHGNIRKWRAARTPYIILYRSNAATVEILRVHHERRDWRQP